MFVLSSLSAWQQSLGQASFLICPWILQLTTVVSSSSISLRVIIILTPKASRFDIVALSLKVSPNIHPSQIPSWVAKTGKLLQLQIVHILKLI